MKRDNQSPWFFVLAAVIGVFVFFVVLLVQPRELTERMIRGQNDFVQFYASAKLNGSSELYSRAANDREIREAAGLQSDALASPSRPPFHSFLFRPLAFLPYLTAYYTFEAISLAAFLFFLWMFVPGCRQLAVYASLSIPLFVTLENGQDSTLALMFAGLSIFLARRNLDFWAGLALSLCAIKFHLFLLIPLVVIFRRRWNILYGGAAGGAILTAISFWRAGMDWPRAYIDVMRNSNLHPSPDVMTNFHTVTAVVGGAAGTAMEVILTVVAIVAVVYLAIRIVDYELAFAFALIGSLLVSFHSYTQDCVILLLALAILLKKPFSKSAMGVMELAVSPIPFFCLYFGTPYNLVMPALLAAVLGIAVAHYRGPKVLTR